MGALLNELDFNCECRRIETLRFEGRITVDDFCPHGFGNIRGGQRGRFLPDCQKSRQLHNKARREWSNLRLLGPKRPVALTSPVEMARRTAGLGREGVREGDIMDRMAKGHPCLK